MWTVITSPISTVKLLNLYLIHPCYSEQLLSPTSSCIIWMSLLKQNTSKHNVIMMVVNTTRASSIFSAHLCHVFKKGWLLNICRGWIPWIQFAFRCFQLCPVRTSCFNLCIHITEQWGNNVLLFYSLYLTTQGPYFMEVYRFSISRRAWEDKENGNKKGISSFRTSKYLDYNLLTF